MIFSAFQEFGNQSSDFIEAQYNTDDTDNDQDNNENTEIRSRKISFVNVVRTDRVANEEYLPNQRNCIKNLQSKVFPRGHRL